MADEPVNYTLLENGLDFILSAVDFLSGEPDKRDLKYAVLHLHSGIELILKECLRREHWSLVFEKTDEAKKERYESGDFVSVTWKTCLTRLNGICGIDISGDIHTLEELKKKRNRLEHFNIIDTAVALKSATIPVLKFAIKFIDEDLGLVTLSEIDRRIYDGIRLGLANFTEFVNHRMQEIEKELHDFAGSIVTCPRCLQETLAIESGATCQFCGYHSDSPEKVASEFIEKVLDINWHDIARGEEPPRMVCPDCRNETLIYLRDNIGAGKPVYVCFDCGLNWEELYFCGDCGRPYEANEGDLGFCDDCYQYRIEKDD